MRRLTSERAAVAVELPLAVGLFLVPIALLVITLPAWPERQTVARAAAVEAARTAVLAGSWEEGVALGEAAVAQAASNQGIDPDDLVVTWEGSLERGASVNATVTVQMPALGVPGLATVGSWSWSTSHTQRVDDFRSFER